MTKRNKMAIMTTLLEGSKIFTGVESGFIQISKSTGIKLFARRAWRDHSFYGQYYGHKKGLAPAVGQRFSMAVPRSDDAFDSIDEKQFKIYGYFTQVADKVGKRRPSTSFLKKLRDAGLTTWDVHNGNVGMLGDKMVCVDFGPVSQGRRWKAKVAPTNK